MEKISVWWFIIGCIVVWIVTSSCATCRYTDEIGAANQRILGQIESTIEEFERRVDHATELGTGIENEVERTRSLFRAYTAAVEQLRNELRKLQEQVERETKTSDETNSHP